MVLIYKNCDSSERMEIERNEDDNITVSHVFFEHSNISYKKGHFGEVERINTLFLTKHHNPIFSIPENECIPVYNKNPEVLPIGLKETALRRVNQNRDGRKQVISTTEWPYRIHGQLTMVYGQKEYGGTGVLIGPHHVLTAGHNIYNFERNEWATSVSIYFALNENSVPFEEIKAVKAYTFNKWKSEGDKDYDIAILLLNNSIGHIIGWAGLLCDIDQNEKNINIPKEITITGYPLRERELFKKMMTMTHNIKDFSKDRFYYEIDTSGGQSGSGIWVGRLCGFNNIPNPYIVGVHTMGEETPGNGISGVRLSTMKFGKIISWISKSFIALEKTNNNFLSPLLSLEEEDYNSMAKHGKIWGKIYNVSLDIQEEKLQLLQKEFNQVQKFIRGKLIYKADLNSDEVEITIDKLENTLNLSKFTEINRYFNISSGYRKGVKQENKQKYEIWIAPRFLIEKELEETAQHFQPIFNTWRENVPI